MDDGAFAELVDGADAVDAVVSVLGHNMTFRRTKERLPHDIVLFPALWTLLWTRTHAKSSARRLLDLVLAATAYGVCSQKPATQLQTRSAARSFVNAPNCASTASRAASLLFP